MDAGGLRGKEEKGEGQMRPEKDRGGRKGTAEAEWGKVEAGEGRRRYVRDGGGSTRKGKT